MASLATTTTPKKCKMLKRPPMKKEAPLKIARASKDLQ
jgi:hypothetical protein